MRNKSVLTLLGLAVVSTAAATWAVRADRGSELAKGERLLATLDQRIGDVGKVEIKAPGGEFTLLRQGEAWVMPDKGGYPVRGELVRQTLVDLARVETLDAKTSGEALLPRLDLAEPGSAGAKSLAILAEDKDGGLIAGLILGKAKTAARGVDDQSSLTGLRYVRRSTEKQAWLAKNVPEAPATAADWLERSVIDVPAKEVASVAILGASPAILATRDTPDAKSLTLHDIPEGMTAKTADVDNLATILETVTLDDVAATGSAPQPAADARGVEVKTSEGLVVTARSAGEGEQRWVRFAASATSDAAKAKADALNAKLGPWAFKLASFRVTRFDAKLADLLQAPKPPGS